MCLGLALLSLSNILCFLGLYIEVRTVVAELSQYRPVKRNLIYAGELNMLSHHHILCMYVFKSAFRHVRCHNRNSFRSFATELHYNEL
jgi:hypothetical protein